MELLLAISLVLNVGLLAAVVALLNRTYTTTTLQIPEKTVKSKKWTDKTFATLVFSKPRKL